MNSSICALPRSSRARFVLAPCIAAALAAAGSASAQVNPVMGYPNNYLSVSTGWSGMLVANSGYGAGFPNAGSSGTMSVAYDSTPGPTFGTLQSSNVTMPELRAFAAGFGPGAVANSGLLQFTPVVSCQYTIGGYLPFEFLGAFNAAGANGTMTLEQIGGPILASYNTTLFGAPNTFGVLFDAATPTSGLQSGSLAAGIAYKWTWNFNTSLTPGVDAGAIARVAAIDGGTPQFNLSFAVPAPSAAALGAVCCGIMGVRRRRN